MKKDRISKKQNISSIEEIPKLVNFRKLRQANVILHGKSAGFPTQKFQRELQDLFAENTALLRCNEGTFRVRKIYGDGNCMFRAISYILWRNEEEHQSLRAMVVQHIKDNWREYGPFVIAEWNISDCQEYYDYMSLIGTFASELECTVATKLHRMNLSIYRELPGRYELKLVFHNRVNINYETARLLFTGCSESGHYDVLLPNSMSSFFMGQ
ncbi:PREDICTED: uncharacterized protein LOC105624420 [Atta cephalotes]|uniref:OTU domain-containing protein n=1 Tax=Atta cephalotes TaxID=12957 RepID=A0A158NUG8_ATTCE|nr:PREDICTED: uncharacterized protein LOC105624420 [Atta cephalotes]XP_018059099.1 PREDICTED: uncharacterized protein LOC108694246 [Atta colombica]